MSRSGDHPIDSGYGDQNSMETVPIVSLRAGDSPRLNGVDRAHVARLAEMETPLPPILVDRRSMRVIDGMHRLMVASLQGRETIEAVFVEDSEADMFLRAVQENIAHGLPLRQADRRAAAERIISTHPHMSDRAIAEVAGLAPKTIASIRRRSAKEPKESNARVGRDGKVRPLDTSEARRRAAELLTEQPDASLRDVARAVGMSPATVLDVRKRLERGESPVREKPAAVRDSEPGKRSASAVRAAGRPTRGPRTAGAANPSLIVERLSRDPSLHSSERGRGMLRLLHINAVSLAHPDPAAAVPPHCVATVLQLARHYSQMWSDFAQELDSRAQVINPSASGL
jgi:ParB-like chromosome segregation protein Spo0J